MTPRRPSYKDRNKRIAEAHGCILTGRTDGIDPAHWPVRQGHGGGWGLLEFVPLTRRWHRLLDAGDPATLALVRPAAMLYYVRMLRAHPEEYLGPEAWVEEVRLWTT